MTGLKPTISNLFLLLLLFLFALWFFCIQTTSNDETVTHVENDQYIRLENEIVSNGDCDLSVIVCHQSYDDKKVMEIWGFFPFHNLLSAFMCYVLFVDKALWEHMPFHVN